MKRAYSHFRYLIAIIAFLVGFPASVVHADMTSYCQQPPYIIQNAAPNILFMESTSKNMNRFAYYDGFLDNGIIPTTDNLCITDNCTKFLIHPDTNPTVSIPIYRVLRQQLLVHLRQCRDRFYTGNN